MFHYDYLTIMFARGYMSRQLTLVLSTMVSIGFVAVML